MGAQKFNDLDFFRRYEEGRTRTKEKTLDWDLRNKKCLGKFFIVQVCG